MSTHCRVRKAQPRDLSSVIEVEWQSFGEREAYHPWVFIEILSLAPELFIVAECNNEVVGYAMGLPEGEHCHLISIAVAPDMRRRGLGRRLLREFEEACRKLGLKKVKLEVKETNVAAINLYLSEGYIVGGRIKRYYPDGVDALVMFKSDIG